MEEERRGGEEEDVRRGREKERRRRGAGDGRIIEKDCFIKNIIVLMTKRHQRSYTLQSQKNLRSPRWYIPFFPSLLFLSLPSSSLLLVYLRADGRREDSGAELYEILGG